VFGRASVGGVNSGVKWNGWICIISLRAGGGAPRNKLRMLTPPLE
jgi:hypothetical protein